MLQFIFSLQKQLVRGGPYRYHGKRSFFPPLRSPTAVNEVRKSYLGFFVSPSFFSSLAGYFSSSSPLWWRWRWIRRILRHSPCPTTSTSSVISSSSNGAIGRGPLDGTAARRPTEESSLMSLPWKRVVLSLCWSSPTKSGTSGTLCGARCEANGSCCRAAYHWGDTRKSDGGPTAMTPFSSGRDTLYSPCSSLSFSPSLMCEALPLSLSYSLLSCKTRHDCVPSVAPFSFSSVPCWMRFEKRKNIICSRASVLSVTTTSTLRSSLRFFVLPTAVVHQSKIKKPNGEARKGNGVGRRGGSHKGRRAGGTARLRRERKRKRGGAVNTMKAIPKRKHTILSRLARMARRHPHRIPITARRHTRNSVMHRRSGAKARPPPPRTRGVPHPAPTLPPCRSSVKRHHKKQVSGKKGMTKRVRRHTRRLLRRMSSIKKKHLAASLLRLLPPHKRRALLLQAKRDKGKKGERRKSSPSSYSFLEKRMKWSSTTRKKRGMKRRGKSALRRQGKKQAKWRKKLLKKQYKKRRSTPVSKKKKTISFGKARRGLSVLTSRTRRTRRAWNTKKQHSTPVKRHYPSPSETLFPTTRRPLSLQHSGSPALLLPPTTATTLLLPSTSRTRTTTPPLPRSPVLLVKVPRRRKGTNKRTRSRSAGVVVAAPSHITKTSKGKRMGRRPSLRWSPVSRRLPSTAKWKRVRVIMAKKKGFPLRYHKRTNRKQKKKHEKKGKRSAVKRKGSRTSRPHLSRRSSTSKKSSKHLHHRKRATSTKRRKMGKSSAVAARRWNKVISIRSSASGKKQKRNVLRMPRKKLRGHQLQKAKYNKRVAAIARLWRAQQKPTRRQQQQSQQQQQPSTTQNSTFDPFKR